MYTIQCHNAVVWDNQKITVPGSAVEETGMFIQHTLHTVWAAATIKTAFQNWMPHAELVNAPTL